MTKMCVISVDLRGKVALIQSRQERFESDVKYTEWIRVPSSAVFENSWICYGITRCRTAWLYSNSKVLRWFRPTKGHYYSATECRCWVIGVLSISESVTDSCVIVYMVQNVLLKFSRDQKCDLFHSFSYKILQLSRLQCLFQFCRLL